MVNPVSLLNLVPQKTKYTAALGKAAAAKLEAGQTLTSVASELRVSRASLRNWRSRDPRLNASFATFESRKAETKKKRARVKHFKEVTTQIMDAAREDAVDPVQAGLQAQQKAEEVEAERKAKKLSPEQAQEARLQAWFNSDWTELIEQQQERMEQAEMDREMELRAGFWCG
jgi:hypothetical protein